MESSLPNPKYIKSLALSQFLKHDIIILPLEALTQTPFLVSLTVFIRTKRCTGYFQDNVFFKLSKMQKHHNKSIWYLFTLPFGFELKPRQNEHKQLYIALLLIET